MLPGMLLPGLRSWGIEEASEFRQSQKSQENPLVETTSLPVKNGFITEQILNGEEGEIHYSYYLPDNYDANKSYPLMVAMPGYDGRAYGDEGCR